MSEKIRRYVILTHSSQRALMKEVNWKIDYGWIVLGGVTAVETSDGKIEYNQAVAFPQKEIDRRNERLLKERR